MIHVPVQYSQLSPNQRRAVRDEYIKRQNGRCFYCKGDLAVAPPTRIRKIKIEWDAFPPGFLRYPRHLHHSHETDLTIGVVHAYCNAVLWQYCDE